MEKYETLGTIGEGTYGVVLKCRHKATGQLVAIKKFKESDHENQQVKKTALREIQILKRLKHENIVTLLEVFRLRSKFYLVFEYVEKTILEQLELHPAGLETWILKNLMWQLVRALHFCHQQDIIHRDIKPENLLVSRNGVLKLCDFGFARFLPSSLNTKYTEYVSTRWYRAPELLVGDVTYGKAVDIWSLGCMFVEMATGLPLFPGDSDLDQLYQIIRCLGRMTLRQEELFRKNRLNVGVNLPETSQLCPLETRFSTMDPTALHFIQQTIVNEPLDRWTTTQLLQHPFFDHSHEAFETELQEATVRDLYDTKMVKRKHGPKPLYGSLETEKSLGVKPLVTPVVTMRLKIDNGNVKVNDEGKGKTQMLGRCLDTKSSLTAGYLPTLQVARNKGTISPLYTQHKKLAPVFPLPKHKTYGLPLTTEHMIPEKARVSVTSNGNRLEKETKGIIHYPYLTQPHTPAGSLYMNNPYLVQQSLSKRSSHKKTSADVYPPMRNSNSTVKKRGSPCADKMGFRERLYVSPKTFHSTIRAGTLRQVNYTHS